MGGQGVGGAAGRLTWEGGGAGLWLLGHIQDPIGRPCGPDSGRVASSDLHLPKVHWIWHRPTGLANPAQLRIVLSLSENKKNTWIYIENDSVSAAICKSVFSSPECHLPKQTMQRDFLC